MAVIAINALNSNSGGGKSIRDSYLKLLNQKLLEERYVVITSCRNDLDFIDNPNIDIKLVPRFWSKTFLAPLIYRFALGRLLHAIRADVLLNIGDLIVHTSAKQIYIFDWPYALDVHPKVWAGMNSLDWFNRRLKLWLIRSSFHKPDIVIAQTHFIRQRLKELYSLSDIRVINNAVTINYSQNDEVSHPFLPRGPKLLCPSVYYPHKNLEILLELALLIKQAGSNLYIVTTVDPYNRASRRFLDLIIERGLQGVILNIGQVSLDRMQDIYSQCDALLLPTLLESFSIVYLEAMYYGLPILTSDMWFAKNVCGHAAMYFDPFDAEDILHSIDNVMSDSTTRAKLIEAGLHRLSSFPTWEQNFTTYQRYLDELLAT